MIAEIVVEWRRQIVEDTERGIIWRKTTYPDAKEDDLVELHNSMLVLETDLKNDYTHNVCINRITAFGVCKWSITILGGPTCEVR